MQLSVRHLFASILILLILPAAAQRNDVKMTLLSLGSGSTRVSYERDLDGRHSAELTLGLIGAGFDLLHHADPSGYLVKACYKWTLLPQPGSPSPLAGLYLKPELIWTDYSYHTAPSGLTLPEAPLVERHTHQLALLAEVGYQLIVKWFLFDAYCGLGPTLGTGNEHNYYHGFMRFPATSPLAFTAGFRLGYAF